MISVSTDGTTFQGGLGVRAGANLSMYTTTLSGGSATVSNTSVTANSKIFLAPQTTSAAAGALSVTSLVAGVGFSITSSNIADDRVVEYLIIEAK